MKKRLTLLPRIVIGRNGLGWLAVVAILGLLSFSNPAEAQYVTNGTGGGVWTSGTTWSGGQVPPSGSSVTIAANDSVWTNIGGLVNCGDLDIQSGAKLNVLGEGIQMNGAFTIEAGARYINNTDSAKAWPAGASGYSIAPTSTFELGNTGNSTLGWNQSDSLFGNVVIDPNASGGVTCGANLTIQGDLTVNVAKGSYFRGISVGVYTSTGATNFVHHVMGNVTVLGGNLAAVDMGVSATVPLSCTWNIDGNVTVGNPASSAASPRFSPITSEDDLGATGIFNIKGNLSFVNTGRLAAGSNSGSGQSTTQIAQLNLYGNLTFDSTATFGVNSMGNFIINFKGTKPQIVTLGSNASFSHSSGLPQCTLIDTVAAGANVTFTGGHYWKSSLTLAPNGGGAFVVNGTLNIDAADTIKGTQKFILNPGATLGIGATGGIVAASDTAPNAGNVQVDSGRVFSSSANYVYNGTSAQVTGSGLPATVNNLTIDNSAGVALSQATTINGTLYLTAGTFDNTIPFTLGPNGKISITGGKLTAIQSGASSVPKQFSLDQNYPNPFNPTTEIQFAVPKSAHVTLAVYNALGQKVATLVDGNLSAGVYQRVFDGSRYASGVYFARLSADDHVFTAKMLMIK